MDSKSNAAMYREFYISLEYKATQIVRSSSIRQRGRALSDGYYEAGGLMLGGSVIDSVNRTMRAMGDTAKWCRDAVKGAVDKNKCERDMITEVMGTLLLEELKKPANWTYAKRKASSNIGWLCKPRFGAEVPNGVTGLATGTDYYLYFEGRVRPVNLQELSFNFVFVEPNGRETAITLLYVASKMGIKSKDTYKKEVRNKVMPWEKVQLTPEAEISDIFNYVAFYVYPRCVGCTKYIPGYTASKESVTGYNNGVFILLPEQYYKNNCFDVRAMRVISAEDYVALFYKGEFEWCLKDIQPSFVPVERPRKRNLTAMVR